MNQYTGLDYGRGLSNRDPVTGIRYGVIPAHDVAYWRDSAEFIPDECEGDEDESRITGPTAWGRTGSVPKLTPAPAPTPYTLSRPGGWSTTARRPSTPKPRRLTWTNRLNQTNREDGITVMCMTTKMIHQNFSPLGKLERGCYGCGLAYSTENEEFFTRIPRLVVSSLHLSPEQEDEDRYQIPVCIECGNDAKTYDRIRFHRDPVFIVTREWRDPRGQTYSSCQIRTGRSVLAVSSMEGGHGEPYVAQMVMREMLSSGLLAYKGHYLHDLGVLILPPIESRKKGMF